MLADYPLVFKLSHEIPSGDFTARVVIQGRVLMVQEDGEWWCHGVEPGGLTEHGEQPTHAYVAFKAALGEILDDFAEEAESFDEFAATVRRFVEEASDEERWEEARRQIRAGNVDVEDQFKAMRRELGRVSSYASVMRLEQIGEPERNDVALAGAA
jgi:hypothetical protein